MKELEVDISLWEEDFPDKELKVVLKKLSFGDYVDLQDKVADIKIVGSQQIVNPKLGKAKFLMLLKSIKLAPFDITDEGIKGLPFDLGEYLFEQIDEMNSVTSKN